MDDNKTKAMAISGYTAFMKTMDLICSDSVERRKAHRIKGTPQWEDLSSPLKDCWMAAARAMRITSETDQ